MIDRLLKLLQLARSPWVVFVAAVLAVGFLAWKLQASRERVAVLERQVDESRLREAKAAGLLVAEQVKSAALENRLELVSPEVRAAVEAARGAVPSLRVVGIVRAETAPSAAPADTPASAIGDRTPNLAESQGPGATPESPPGAGPRCLFFAGDLGVATTEDVKLESDAGAVAFTGASWCWRVSEPRARLFGGPWRQEVSSAAAEPPPAASGGLGWGAGAWGMVGRGGAVAGPALAPPPLRLGPVQVELTAGGGTDLRGEWGAGATLILRRSP